MPITATKRPPIRFSYNDYILLPEGTRYEILEGKLFPVPVPSITHQAIVLKIAAALLRHVEARRLGEVFHAPCNVVLSNETVMQPDILFVGRKRRAIIGAKNLQGKPDLVLEVLSQKSSEMDLTAKKKIYARFEVQEYWVVDPAAGNVETLVWSELGYVSVGSFGASDSVSSPLLPNFHFGLSGVFRTEYGQVSKYGAPGRT